MTVSDARVSVSNISFRLKSGLFWDTFLRGLGLIIGTFMFYSERFLRSRDISHFLDFLRIIGIYIGNKWGLREVNLRGRSTLEGGQP